MGFNSKYVCITCKKNFMKCKCIDICLPPTMSKKERKCKYSKEEIMMSHLEFMGDYMYNDKQSIRDRNYFRNNYKAKFIIKKKKLIL